MAEDYDAPRRRRAEEETDEPDMAVIRQAAAQATDVLDLEAANVGEVVELPWADLTGEDLEARVIPRQADEFTCSRCFLVYHRSRLARTKGKQKVCRDCA